MSAHESKIRAIVVERLSTKPQLVPSNPLERYIEERGTVTYFGIIAIAEFYGVNKTRLVGWLHAREKEGLIRYEHPDIIYVGT